MPVIEPATGVSTDVDLYQPQSLVSIQTPDWSKDAVIYEINLRQFTKEGTFRAAEAHLPRLKQLGVSILWLMPIHPIGNKNRKGSLGSPYAVRDYFSLNPEFGCVEDMRHFVDYAHELGLYVIIDWVANHSAWDNVLVEQHPHWYAKNHQGDFTPTPWWDWDDIIDFDYSQPELRAYMASAMRYWVNETDIDGYRCDVAGFVPQDFWALVRRQLDAIKPVFMLAEWEARDLHYNAFDMSYAWSWNEAMHGIAMGKLPLSKLYKYYSWNEKSFPKASMRMTFVSNHDKNAWDGTQFEQFGDALECAIVLSVLGEGMPLIYNGQEAGNPKRLAFFERDPIDWRGHRIGDLYTDLIALKKAHSALHNGQWGARMIPVTNSYPDKVFSFMRQDKASKVIVMLNLSGEQLPLSLTSNAVFGPVEDWHTGERIELTNKCEFNLAPWQWLVFTA
ncbi:MAG: alpha-amylase family glycosyl hydrolase [Paraglaciecola chathamensis]|jgi:1,4-alpha-glucan branching enzyme|uniref:Alpha-amylase, putative n=1 Tax=Paraglaciecola agarilytica NO2 TaxID=1125747 RepID=A0ABQ0I5J6_9ALTE|nr:alpha-amylase family glycosyl hydrolase [Paraglaciecola agarilytica]GAC04635.1 alpha-amylase, putative [Paraglaciecola agarilytica NO2]